MRSLFFLIGVVILLSSCNTENTEESAKSKTSQKEKSEEPAVIDSLPDATWNGEYMKIDDEEEPKIKRKSQGSDFYNMGRVDLKIGEEHIDFKLFERKRNALTFTNNSINAIIKSAFNEDLHVHFKKESIVLNHKGKYTADPTGKANTSFKMEITAGPKDQQKTYTLEKGEAELIDFSPQLGTFEMKVSGLFTVNQTQQIKGKGTIKMRFEHAVMTL